MLDEDIKSKVIELAESIKYSSRRQDLIDQAIKDLVRKIEDEFKVKIIELIESIKYSSRRQDLVDQEIKELVREDAKQGEEIKDAIFLTESLKMKMEVYEKNCFEHKLRIQEANKDEKILIADLNDKLEKASQKKLVIGIQTILAAIVVILTILGTISGVIKFVGW